LYSTVADAVKFVGACELGEDKKCHAKVETQWHCPIGMKLTGVYTTPDVEGTPEDESATSEFMEPFECSFFVVKPQEEFVMTTPSSGASGEVAVEGAGIAPAKKMCTLMVDARATFTPLMWLFLSVGILGGMRIIRRK
jgi:hypothetical protein